MESCVLLKTISAFVLLWDNSNFSSLQAEDINLLKERFHFEYYHCPSNKPLSTVYNNVIEKFIAKNEYKYLIVLDDDSKISLDYFNELKNIIESNNDVDIILPVAKNNNI